MHKGRGSDNEKMMRGVPEREREQGGEGETGGTRLRKRDNRGPKDGGRSREERTRETDTKKD